MWPFGNKGDLSDSEPKRKKPKRRFIARAFQSAQTDRFNSEWSTSPVPINNLLKNNLRSLRARSRDRFINDDYAKRFLSIVKTNVIGPRGFQLQAQCKTARGKLDDACNKAIEKAHKDWTRRRNCHWEGMYTYLDIQKQIISEIMRDGEYIGQKLIAGKYGYQIKALDSELLDITYNKKLDNGAYISMGVEFDSQNKKRAYHFLTDDRSQDQVYSYYDRNYQRIEADKIYHYFIPEFPNQIRGIPQMHTAMRRLKNLDGYEWAAIVAARAGAQKMGFFYEEDQEASNYDGDDEDESESPLITESEAGTWEKLPPGVRADTYDPTYPHQQYPEFVKATLRGAASGMGVNYNTLANDLEGVNFSSIRHATLEDREYWKELQQYMIDHPMTDFYEDWLEYALLSGQIKVGNGKGALDPINKEKYLDVSFIPRRWEWIEPLKDTQAKSMQLEKGMTSLTRVIRDRGDDPETIFNEIKTEREKLKSMGVEISHDGNSSGNGTNQDDSDDESDGAQDKQPKD